MPETLERFAHAPERPPDKVIQQLHGRTWHREQVGHDGPFPNGGIWRYEPGLVMKRIGAQFPGGDKIWSNSTDPGHSHWWLREADFYRSELATTGWGPQARPARCYAVTDGPAETIELWLEALDIPSHEPDTYEKALASLAHWQVATAKTTADWLSKDWIPSHLRRRGLDNAKTLAHPGWPHAFEHGLDPRVREAVHHRVTDPVDARRRLAGLPQVLTHYDFHNCNIGRTPEGDVRIIDWAYVGWGPIGQDVGHLAIDAWSHLRSTPRDTWTSFADTYVGALQAAGWTGPAEEVRHSIAVSTAIRHGWVIGHLLEHAAALPDELWPSAIQTVEFVAGLIERLPRN
jgi:hypothetical protein